MKPSEQEKLIAFRNTLATCHANFVNSDRNKLFVCHELTEEFKRLLEYFDNMFANEMKKK